MRTALALALTTVACGSSGPAWMTYHSASCDATFDLAELPASNRIAENTYFGDTVATAHGIDRADGSRLVYGCRSIPAAYWTTRSETTVAREVLDGELGTFDASWGRGEVKTEADGSLFVALTSKDSTAELRMRGVASEARAHGSIVKGANTADKKRFLAGIHLDPPATKGPITVRSAECLSSVSMPGWPTGELAPPTVTHYYTEADTRRWQLRCVFLGESEIKLTPAEIFAMAEADTMRGVPLELVSKVDIDVDGRPGRDMRFESTDKTRSMQIRVVVDGDRVQAATYDSPIAEKDAGVRFTKSLRLLRPKP